MEVKIRGYKKPDLKEMIKLWNDVVEEGISFPYEEPLTYQTGEQFFAEQTCSVVAEDAATGNIYGLYILHPNNIGRCSHICNASYLVSHKYRGQHIGEKLVLDSLVRGKQNGYKVLQFNAVVASNVHARQLYERLGFVQLGVIPEGFRMKDGTYEDIYSYYYELQAIDLM